MSWPGTKVETAAPTQSWPGQTVAPAPAPKMSILGDYGDRLVGNIIPSGAHFIGNMVDAVTHPIQTIGNLGTLAGSTAKQAENLIENTFGYNGLVPDEHLAPARNLANFYANRYGSFGQAAETLANDPIGTLADASIPIGGVEFAGAKLGELPGIVGTVGRTAQTAARTINPVNAPGAAVRALTPAKISNRVAAVAKPFSNEGRELIAGRILNENAGSYPTQIQPAPLPGMLPTLGQSTNNPGLLWMERSLNQGPGGAEKLATSRTANNQAILDAASSLGNFDTPAAELMGQRLEAVHNAEKTATAAKWKAAGVDETTGIPVQGLSAAVTDYMNGLTISGKKNVPADILDTLDEIKKSGTTNLGEVQDWRANVGDAKRAAVQAGQMNKFRVLKGLEETVGNFIDDFGGIGPATGESIEAYKNARAATRDLKARFNEPGSPVNTALSYKEFGQAAPSNTADLFIKPNTSAGAPEAFNSYLKALGNDPQGLQATRDAFMQKFMESVQSVVPDQSGERFILPGKVTKFTDKYDHIINSPLFDDSQRAIFKKIQDASDMGARTQRAIPPGGSDTAGKLLGNQFIDVLIGPGAGKIIPGAAAVAGMTHGPVSSGIGFILGKSAENAFESALLNAPREKVVALLNEAIADPELAKALMMKATPGNAKMIKPAVRAKITKILVGETAISQPQTRSIYDNSPPGLYEGYGQQ